MPGERTCLHLVRRLVVLFFSSCLLVFREKTLYRVWKELYSRYHTAEVCVQLATVLLGARWIGRHYGSRNEISNPGHGIGVLRNMKTGSAVFCIGCGTLCHAILPLTFESFVLVDVRAVTAVTMYHILH